MDQEQDETRFVRREVRAEDPGLSPEANRLLTAELQDALGTDEVEIPADRAEEAGRVGVREHRSLATQLYLNRMLVGITFAMLIVVGVIASLATGSWWALVAAVAVHAVATFLVLAFTLQVTSEVEHVAPSTAARLEDEGVADPDQALSDLLDQYGPSEGGNEVSASPDQDPARSAVEQRNAITPAGSPVGPSSDKVAPTVLPIVAVAGSVIVGLIAAIAIGGIAWVGAGLLVLAAVAWALLVGQVDDASAHPRKRLLPIVGVVILGAVATVIIVGAIAGYL